MSILKKLAGETLSYGFSTILGRSLNFLLVFVHTIAFLPAELGINVKLYGYMAIANIIYTYGMETAYFRYAKEAPDKYYNLILSAIIATSGLFTLCLFLFSDPIMAQLGYENKGIFLKWLAVILAIDAITAAAGRLGLCPSACAPGRSRLVGGSARRPMVHPGGEQQPACAAPGAA